MSYRSDSQRDYRWVRHVVVGVVATAGLTFQFVLALSGASIEVAGSFGATTAAVVAALVHKPTNNFD